MNNQAKSVIKIGERRISHNNSENYIFKWGRL